MKKKIIAYNNFENFLDAIKRVKPKIIRHRVGFIWHEYMFAEKDTLHLISIANWEEWHTVRIEKIKQIGIELMR